MDTSIKDQLEGIRNKTNVIHEQLAVMPAVYKYKGDGIDHVNIWERGQTRLGKFLAFGSKTPFKHKVFGTFNTIETFWHYISSEERDDRIRNMNTFAAKKFSEGFTKVKVSNFYAIIMLANWDKIKEYPEEMQLLKDNELPLEMYYTYKTQNVPIRPVFAAWAIQGFTEIHKALIEEREPDFTFLMTNPTDDIYGSLLK